MTPGMKLMKAGLALAKRNRGFAEAYDGYYEQVDKYIAELKLDIQMLEHAQKRKAENVANCKQCQDKCTINA